MTQLSESTSITAARDEQVPDARPPAARRAEQIGRAEGRDDEIGFEHLDVEAEPDEYRGEQQPAQAASLHGAADAVRAEQHGQHEQAVDSVVAVGDDADRRAGEEECGEQPGDGAEDAPDQHVDDADGDHAGQRLRQEDAEAAVAEDLGARRLDPKAERRLIDGDEAARIEGDEEKVVPALQHTADRRGVVEVVEAVALQLPEVAERRQQQDQGEHVTAARLDVRARALVGDAQATLRGWVGRQCAGERRAVASHGRELLVGMRALSRLRGCDGESRSVGARRAHRNRRRYRLESPG